MIQRRPIMPSTTTANTLEERVVSAAEAALADERHVSAVDVFVRIRWLAPGIVGQWEQGRLGYLEEAIQARPEKVSSALEILGRWARRRGLEPSETAFVARTRDRRPLRFTESGGDRERAYRTRWLSPDLSPKRRELLAERLSKPPDLVVIMPLKDWTCAECGGTGDLLMMEDAGPLCMECADLDHLVFLPSGDATLTRRAKKASGLAAVVVRFSRARKRYERQGILVEEPALEQAEAECLADEEARRRARARAEERRAEQDVEFQARLAAEIRRLFPGCPPKRAEAIAAHAGARGSGRVGRSAAGRAFDPTAVALAVVASVRHRDTRYDELLMSGYSRQEARWEIEADVERVLDRWRGG
jgi:hypothetical protein